MEYAYSKNLKGNFKSIETNIVQSLSEVGFGILTEINIKDAFKAKLNLSYKHYKILGACNPTLAHEALGYEQEIGILMPCNILIIDNEDGTIKIIFPKAEGVLQTTQNDKVHTLSKKVDKLLKTAFDNIC
ncbi:MAG: hypothetical protein CMG67_03135 [Candidatus Marinimicrobia bacterium]|nr:hypothetical protein [Candidatus Neomarinimicrobiota bacterium]